MASGSLNRNMESEEVDKPFKSITSKLKWGDLSADIVMNIGCGHGAFIKYLLSMKPNVKRVIGVDLLRSNVEKAAAVNTNPNFEYYVADIEKKASIRRWKGQISKVVSDDGFQYLKNIEIGFQNVYDLLIPNGEAAIYFTLRSPYFDWFWNSLENSKWATFIGDVDKRIPESHVKRLRLTYFRKLLESIGFTVLACKEVGYIYKFTDDEECKKTALSEYIPAELRREFEDDLLRILSDHTDRSIGGQLQLHFISLVVIIKKEIKG